MFYKLSFPKVGRVPLLRRMPGSVHTLPVPAILSSQILNTKNQIIRSQCITIGTLNSSLVHPREIFNFAIKNMASSIIVAHNHPSGEPTPSMEDINATKRLIKVGKILDIPILDHIIIGKHGKYESILQDEVLKF